MTAHARWFATCHAGLGWVDLAIVGDFTPNGMEVHITIDVVEAMDVAARLTFGATPTGDIADPSGLLAS